MAAEFYRPATNFLPFEYIPNINKDVIKPYRVA